MLGGILLTSSMLGCFAVPCCQTCLVNKEGYIIAFQGVSRRRRWGTGRLGWSDPWGALQDKGYAGLGRHGRRLRGGGCRPWPACSLENAPSPLRRRGLLPVTLRAGGAGDGLPGPREHSQGLRHLPGEGGPVYRRRVCCRAGRGRYAKGRWRAAGRGAFEGGGGAAFGGAPPP